MSVKNKSAMSIKLDDRYKAILEIAVEKMKGIGMRWNIALHLEK